MVRRLFLMSKTLKVKKNKKVEITKVFREPVRLLRETATPKKYARRFYQHEDRKKANKYNRHYIRIACGSQEPVICDKTYQMDENGLATDYEDLKAGVLLRRGTLWSRETQIDRGLCWDHRSAGLRSTVKGKILLWSIRRKTARLERCRSKTTGFAAIPKWNAAIPM